MTPDQLPPGTKARIEADAQKHSEIQSGNISREDCSYCAQDYIAGATAEALKNKACVEALERLVKLKLHKDTMGKTVYYQKEQPLAWEAATTALNNLK